MDMAEAELNGHPFDVAKTTPNRLAQLNDVDDMLREYNKNNNKNYLFDPEFRGKYLKAVSDVVIDYEEDDFNPGEEFYKSGDLEVSTIQDARLAFLNRGGMMRV